MDSFRADNRHSKRAVRHLAAFASVLVCLSSLLLVNCEAIVPPQGWSKKWGPLVPHNTFPADCSLCHVPDRWDVLHSDFTFDHEAETGVALNGAHATAACLRCHNDRGPVAKYVERGCGGCHPDIHKGTLGLDCKRCHDEVTWRPTGLIAEHARTRFPLYGVHAATPCESCHEGATVGDFRGAPVDCDICHQDDLARALIPDHVAAGWTRNCERCHNPGGWAGANINHDFFPLLGGHGGLDCSDCHTAGIAPGLAPISSDCFACHKTDYELAPNHLAFGFPTTCDSCHTIITWLGAQFDHRPPLPPCVNCHLEEYQGAPDHVAFGFPQTCENCHTTTTWRGANFDHTPPIPPCTNCHADEYQFAPNHVAFGFPQTCEQCHGTNVWRIAAFGHPQPLPPCIACHEDDYQVAPNHVAFGFPQTCEQCHNTAQWRIPIFAHLPPLPPCIACHEDDYRAAPDHVELNFSQTCEDCHNTTAWSPNGFVHNFFPLVGPHDESCSTCHNAGSTRSFTCLVCHAHRQSRMDAVHEEVGGYVYESQACLDCHPDGTKP